MYRGPLLKVRFPISTISSSNRLYFDLHQVFPMEEPVDQHIWLSG